MTYTADEVDQKIAQTKAELLEYINKVIAMQKRGETNPSDYQLLLKETTVEEMDIEKDYVRVTVSMFGRETPVELEIGQAELLTED